jgi:phage tail tape-measure protein
MSKLLRLSPLAALLVLGACTTIPNGPSVMVMPGAGKSFDQFRADDADCRQYAQSQIGGATANDAAIKSGVESAAVGTAVGALAGAAMGGHQGAGAGAGVGLLAGSAMGANAGQASGNALQRRYDMAYMQCMYAKGDSVPGSSQPTSGRQRRSSMPPQPYTAPPSSPPMYYPPPPPGAMPPQ